MLVTAVLAVLALGARVFRFATTAQASHVAAGQWLYLSDLAWSEASTGWLGVANEQVPARDRAFRGPQISLNGLRYEKGLGTYPLSEIIYNLDGEYLEFAADVGLDDEAQASDAAVRFLVFLDGTLVAEIGPMRPGDQPRRVQVPVVGARQMRLVVDAPPDQSGGGYADWADARLLKPVAVLGDPSLAAAVTKAQERQRALADARQKDGAALLARGRNLAASLPAEVRRPIAASERPTGLFDSDTARLWLSTGRLALGVGLGGTSHATLTLLDLERQRPLLLDAVGSIEINEHAYPLSVQSRSVGTNVYSFAPVDDPILGPGTRLDLRLVTRDGHWHPVLHFTLFGNGVVLYEMSLADEVAPGQATPIFHFFAVEGGKETLWVGEDAEYLTDFSRLRYARIFDDGLLRRESVGGGKPIFIWSNRPQRGLLMALLEESAGRTCFRVQLDPGRVQGRLGLSSGAATARSDGLRSPRLYLEATPRIDMNRVFRQLQQVLDHLYPEVPLPAWVKYQWLSWYAYNMDISEDIIRSQADYIARNLADLGAWNLLIDAGWYVSEGRPDADWRNVDREKFPDGLSPLVERIHSQGSKVVLYLSAPYVDSRQQSNDWLGLRGIIEEHPEWLQPLGGDDNRQSYAFDFRNPAVRDYWSLVMDDFFLRYGVDGIKIDGIGNAEGAILDPDKMDAFGLVDDVNKDTMVIYDFFYREVTRRRPDAYLETGWLSPTFARPFVHTFRYGDEAPLFSSPYPFPGLVEHVNYAIIQRQILGQRPNMGAIYDDPNHSVINRWWLEAGLALGTHVTIGFDLTQMRPETLSRYRSLLTHYQPFSGTTTFGMGLRPRTFATERQGTTYLGVLNREQRPLTVRVPLSEHGLQPAQAGEQRKEPTAYDVENDLFLKLSSPFTVTLPAESFRLFIVREQPGVVWTNSAFSAQETSGTLQVTLRGPSGLPGYAYLVCPPPARVTLDGKVLKPVDRDPVAGRQYTYDRNLDVLLVRYENRPEGHVIFIEY